MNAATASPQPAATGACQSGLSEGEAAQRLVRYGPNELPSTKRRDVVRIALEVVREPMLLLVAGGTSGVAAG